MDFIYIFFAGFIAAFGGTILPGLLNLTAAKIAIEHSEKKVNLYILGACTITALYSFIAAQFSFYIDQHPNFITGLNKIGAVIFSILTIYFFWKDHHLKKNNNIAVINKKNFYFTGIFLSILNILPLPFYTGITLLLSKNNLFNFSTVQMFLLITSIVIGTASALKIYSIILPKFNKKLYNSKVKRNRNNLIIGIVTAILTLIAIYQLV